MDLGTPAGVSSSPPRQAPLHRPRRTAPSGPAGPPSSTPSPPLRPGSPLASASCPAGLPPQAGSKPRYRCSSPSPQILPCFASPVTTTPVDSWDACRCCYFPLSNERARRLPATAPRPCSSSLSPRAPCPLPVAARAPPCLAAAHQRPFCLALFWISKDETPRPVPGPSSFFSENFAKYHEDAPSSSTTHVRLRELVKYPLDAPSSTMPHKFLLERVQLRGFAKYHDIRSPQIRQLQLPSQEPGVRRPQVPRHLWENREHQVPLPQTVTVLWIRQVPFPDR
ncbi:hypothetical protein VPH35_002118 [Triticum aestivum]